MATPARRRRRPCASGMSGPVSHASSAWRAKPMSSRAWCWARSAWWNATAMSAKGIACWCTRASARRRKLCCQQVLDGGDDGLRSLARQKMSRDRNQPALIGAGEMPGIRVGHVRRGDAIRLACQHDRRNCNRWLGGQILLNALQRGVAGGLSVAMAIGMDADIDEIWIVPARGGGLEGGVVELPVGRPEAPHQPAEIAPIAFQPQSATFGVEIPLVPVAVFRLGWSGIGGRPGDALAVVAADRHPPLPPGRA